MRLFVALLLATTCAWSADTVTMLYPMAGDSIPADGIKHFAAETTGTGAVSYVTYTVGGTLAASTTWNTTTASGKGWPTQPNTALTAGATTVIARSYTVTNVLLATSPTVSITVTGATVRPYVAVAIAPATSYDYTEVTGVNNTGMVIGNSFTQDINWDRTGSKAFWYDSSSQTRVNADHTAIRTALGLGVAVTNTAVHSINDSGESVGMAMTGTGPFLGYHFRRSAGGVFTRLQPSVTSVDSVTLGEEDHLCIDASGSVVGHSAVGMALSPPWTMTDLANFRAHSWTAANVQTNLHTSVGSLLGTVDEYVDIALATSNNKMIGVYASVTGGTETIRGWYGGSLSAATALIPVDPTLTGAEGFAGEDINASGIVVVSGWRSVDLGGGNNLEENYLYTWASGDASLTRVLGLGVSGYAEGKNNDDNLLFGRSDLVADNGGVAFIKPVSSVSRPVIYDVKANQLTNFSDSLINDIHKVEDVLESGNGTGGAFVIANGSLRNGGGMGANNQRGLILRANRAPTVAMTAPLGGSIVAGTSTTFSATASDADSDILTPGLQKVEFYANDGTSDFLLGTDTTSPYSISYTPTIAGSYTLFARAYDLTDGSTNSVNVATTVTAPPAGVLSFSVSNFSVGESAGSATITVNRTGGTTGAVSVNYATSGSGAGYASGGIDYTTASGTLSWADGVSTAQTFTVPILVDTLVEGDELITITLSSPTNFASAGSPATLTITDDDCTVAFSSATTTVLESGSLTLTVERLGGSGGQVTADYMTTNGTANAGTDFVATTGTVILAPGVNSRTIVLSILDDTTVESDETFTVTLSNVATTAGSAALGATPTNTVTITDDDTTFAFTSATSSGAENGGAITVSVTRAGNVAAAGTQTVVYATSDGTATAGSDYTAATGTLTFAGTATTATFTVTPTADTTVEADETVNLALSLVSNDGTITGGAAVLTITNDDTAVAFSAATYLQAESGTAATITVQRTGLLSGASTVAYAASSGIATSGSDFSATAGTLNFAAGEATKTFTVPSIIDALVEADETVNLALTSPTGATLGSQATAVLTITDPQAGLLAFSVSAATVGESAGTATITVTRSGGTVGAVTVDYATSNGTATAGSDYTATSGTLSWADGNSTAQTFTVLVTTDTAVEGDETITLTLSNPTNSAVAGGTVTLTITDDDCTVAFASATTAIGESGSNASITVTRSGGTGGAFTVDFAAIPPSTATPGSDYTTTSGTLIFAAGDLTKTITVAILDDTTVESDETFTVTLSNVVATTGTATLGGTPTTTATISDDDTTFAFSSATYGGAENNGAITVTVTRAGNVSAAGTQTVNYATSDGTATAGSDYTAASGTLTFTGVATTATFTVAPTPDTTVEADETVNLALSLVSNDGTITGGAAVLTITNDDTTVEFAAATYTQTEDGVAATITVQRAGLTTSASTVTYTASNGSALAGGDYVATTGTLTFAAGVTTQTFTVTALSDALVEGDESMTVTLSAPTGATLGAQTTTVLTIQDNDAPANGVMQFSAATYAIAEGNAGTATATITVTRTGGSTGAVDVTYATSNGTATAGSDYTTATATLAFLAAETSKTFTVTVAGDTTAEADETVTLTLSAPTGGAVLGTQLVSGLTITNDDGAVPVPVATATSSDDDSKCSSGLALIMLLALSAMGAGFAGRRRLD